MILRLTQMGDAMACCADLGLVVPTDVTEATGEGVAGYVNRKRVVIGGHGFVAARSSPHAIPADRLVVFYRQYPRPLSTDDRSAGNVF